jgi:hypothetical protein
MSRPWLGRSRGVREKFLQWATTCPGLATWTWWSTSGSRSSPGGACTPGRSRALRRAAARSAAASAGGPGWAGLEGGRGPVTQDLARVRIRRLPDFRVLAEGGPEVYAAWLAGQHRRNRSVSTASRRYP